MNSRQRRYIRRYWRYITVIDTDSFWTCMEAREWCEKQFGKVGYRWGNYKWDAGFCFRHQKDYTLFLLKWS